MTILIYLTLSIISAILYITILRRYKINLFFYICLILYVGIVLSVTLLPVHSYTPLTFQELMLHVNIIPFFQNYEIMDGMEISQCIQNAIMFMPLGILIPLTFKRVIKMRKFILLCFGLSLTIETLQLLLTYQGIVMRVFDINDLIFNTMGGTFTYAFIYFIGQCLYRQKEQVL
ncbi:MAG: VanZ family protein [Coprobacillus sp.]